jgi:hypothetical protein
MAYYDKDELKDLYQTSTNEAYEWRKNYQEYERLADNGLLDDLDETLPEVNDGSLAAALFKLPKRIVNSDMTGRFRALDADDAWITELANIYWENKIIPNANSQAPFHRKWKDVVRKAAIYGSQPIISMLVTQGDYIGADFIVPYAQDVYLEPGKVSDYDSDIIFWDVYYTQKQVEGLIEDAKAEEKDSGGDGYNKWNIKKLEEILAAQQEEDREANQEHEDKANRSVIKGGVKFFIAFQRGVEAPFYMCHSNGTVVREWSNPDPTGNIPVKYLFNYQDFNNPYGIGIVRLAGGTQNVLDIMRKYDVLSTQLGIRPPKKIRGNEDEVDEDSMVYAQDANWYVGNAEVDIVEMANGVYNQLPGRISMYQTSLSKMLPTGDTSVSGSDSGDPNFSKTPAGIKFKAAELSVDDEDFRDNLNMTYEAVAKDLINITFANMQGSDLLRLNDDEIELLSNSGLEFPLDGEGNPSRELEIIWDEARATFDFELDAEDSKAKDEDTRLQALIQVMELRASDPLMDQKLALQGKRFNDGELIDSLISLITDNDKIISEITPEEQQAQQLQQQGLPGQDPTNSAPQGQPQQGGEVTPEQAQVNMEAVMQEHGVDQETAAEMLEAEFNGVPPEQVLASLEEARNA